MFHIHSPRHSLSALAWSSFLHSLAPGWLLSNSLSWIQQKKVKPWPTRAFQSPLWSKGDPADSLKSHPFLTAAPLHCTPVLSHFTLHFLLSCLLTKHPSGTQSLPSLPSWTCLTASVLKYRLFSTLHCLLATPLFLTVSSFVAHSPP